MLFFYPFRNRVTEVHNNAKILDKYKECQELVQYEQRLFEPNPEFMDYLENINDTLDIKDNILKILIVQKFF